MRCWGLNTSGQIGNGSTSNATTPKAVFGVSGATAIQAGTLHTCALVSGGAAKCWGANDAGQLGTGTTTNATSAQSVSGISGATALAAGSRHTCVLASGGTAKCWGRNTFGQLGTGNTTDALVPQSVSGLSGAEAIAAGGDHTCALMTAGTITCWGSNFAGQLGNGTYADATTPSAVSGLTGAAAVAGSTSNTCAILADGTVACWGDNLNGAVGNGTAGTVYTAAQPALTKSATSLSALLSAGVQSVVASYPGSGSVAASVSPVVQQTVKAAGQTITFTAPADTTYGAAPVTLNASVGSGLPIGFASETADVCTVAGATATIVGAGTCTITASQGGNGNYLAANDVQQSFNVAKAPQTIAFDAPADTTFGASPVTLVASVGSGLPIGFASETTDVCTVAGATATIVGAGTCTITASQGGNGNYLAANDVQQSFNVAKAPQTIAFNKPADTTFGASPMTLNASVGSGLPIGFASATTEVCTVAGDTATIVGAGTCTITASQGGNDNYMPAADVSQSFAVAKATQTISFPPVADVPLGAPPVALGATASSGLGVSYASTTATICTVSDAKVSLLAVGVCSLAASQAGNDNYLPARDVTTTFTVKQGGQTQTISFTQPGDTVFGAGPVALAATASSNLTVSFASGSAAVCSVAGNTATILAAGTCTVTASQAGNDTYAPAPPVVTSFAVRKARTFVVVTGAPSTSVQPGAPVPVTARVAAIAPGGGVPDGVVTFSEGGTVYATPTLAQGKVAATLTTQISGSHAVKASYAGSANYLPSEDGTVFSVDPRIGPPILVDEVSARERSHPTVTRLTNGTSLVVWDAGDDEGSGSGLLGRRYDAAGKPIGTVLRIGQGSCGDLGTPAVAALPKGRFVVAWQTDGRGRLGTDVALRWFDELGRPMGEAVVVNETRIGWQSRPTVTALADGDVLVGWQSAQFLDATASIRARRYSGTGVARGREMRVDVSDRTSQTAPTVVGLPDGGYAFAYVSATPGQVYSARIVGRVYTAANLPGMEVPISDKGATALEPAVAVTADGNLVVLWSSAVGPQANRGILAQRLRKGPLMAAIGTPIRLDGAGLFDAQPTVASFPSGGFIAAWVAVDRTGAAVMMARYGSTGTVVDPAQEIPVRSATVVTEPAIAVLSDTAFSMVSTAATWRDRTADIALQRFGLGAPGP